MVPDRTVPQVRRLRAQDRQRWGELWHGYLSFYRADLSDEVTDLTFRRLCERDQGMLGLVAVDTEDRPIGLAHLVFHPATWSAEGYCYLEDLFVDRGQRGGLVARTLFAAVYAQARERGVGRVYWNTQQYNGAARSLYDTVGELTSFVVYEHTIENDKGGSDAA
ncbi:MAG: GNAT family N-acetyltransferase [Solirubrobacteraceae bacterium]